MSIELVNKVRPMTGLTFAEKMILWVLADASYDGETVFLRMDKLSLYASCSARQARRILRRLEQKGLVVPQGKTGGRGYVHVYRFNLDSQESTPEEPPAPREEISPPRQFKAPIPVATNHRLSPENEEYLQRLRRDLAKWQGQQAKHIQETGQPHPAFADWIDIVEQKIAKVEKKIGET